MDKGPHYSKHDFDLKFDEIRYYARGAIVPHMSTDPMTWPNGSRYGQAASLGRRTPEEGQPSPPAALARHGRGLNPLGRRVLALSRGRVLDVELD